MPLFRITRTLRDPQLGLCVEWQWLCQVDTPEIAVKKLHWWRQKDLEYLTYCFPYPEGVHVVAWYECAYAVSGRVLFSACGCVI